MTKWMRLRTLPQGDPIPEGRPTRTIHSNGYVLLLWPDGPGAMVRAYEHRIVMGNPVGGQVHHKNHIKTDNRPENLELLAPLQHRQVHASWDIAAAAKLYEAGWSSTRIGRLVGVTGGAVMSSLRAYGVRPRGRSESAEVGWIHRAPRAVTPTRCRRGHELIGDNLFMAANRDGKVGRRCRTCHLNGRQAYSERRRRGEVVKRGSNEANA